MTRPLHDVYRQAHLCSKGKCIYLQGDGDGIIALTPFDVTFADVMSVKLI
jgi:hypothetical protein